MNKRQLFKPTFILFYFVLQEKLTIIYKIILQFSTTFLKIHSFTVGICTEFFSNLARISLRFLSRNWKCSKLCSHRLITLVAEVSWIAFVTSSLKDWLETLGFVNSMLSKFNKCSIFVLLKYFRYNLFRNFTVIESSLLTDSYGISSFKFYMEDIKS